MSMPKRKKDKVVKPDFRKGDRKLDVDLVPDFNSIQCGGCGGLTFYVRLKIAGPTPEFEALVCRHCNGEMPMHGTPVYGEGKKPIDLGKTEFGG